MHTFVRLSTTDPRSRDLLDEYFAERAVGFEGGDYIVTHPDPARFVDPDGAFVVLLDGDTPVGCGGVRALSPTRFEIKHVFLRPAARGAGWGRRLLETLEAEARALGARELVLDTNATLAAAGGLYRSSGYVEIEPYNSNPNANHWYGKQLTA
ncbi:GNAT superfamily N-acetyltransferase [Mycetocola sp. BIGb0189]|uniref:GNAT family N-acetyltransferase n=1 Tax=Mycetocola sp. BIGb0189 TaxID=2940604 RepID=UPI002168EE13|nr:GNAT family N-acetyltransferase [Mycetocola sp. BIGb0189]MCS4275051.1 GNAT superfamily N-acetyltransferase [Mycetocola sp. BIGb0189]